MKVTFTKYFFFSASYAAQNKIHAHNYVLGVTTGPLDQASEILLEKKVNDSLIKKLDARDLKLDVDFLKGVDIDDARLLECFWKTLETQISPMILHTLSLERDKKTRVALSRR